MENKLTSFREIEDNGRSSSETSVLANMTVTDQIRELTSGLDVISLNLRSQVRNEYGALLSQATHAGHLDTTLNFVAGDVDRIQGTANKLKTQIVSQYSTIHNLSKVLDRLHNASHTLRSCDNVLNLTHKLRNSKDVLKQAALHYELEPLVGDVNLSKIESIQDERNFVLSSRLKLNNYAQMQLVNGLKERNSNCILSSLKIFLNFRLVEESLNNLIKTYLAEISQSIKECFAGTDISALTVSSGLNCEMVNSSPNRQNALVTHSTAVRGPGKTPTLTTTQNYRAKFWKSLHWLIYEELYEYCDQITLLKNCLQEINLITFISPSKAGIQKKFWNQVQEIFRTSFSECAKHVSQTLEEGLPKLLSSARSLEVKLGTMFKFDEDIFEPLKVGYLIKCGANLKSPFLGIDFPSHENIDKFIKVASAELIAASVDNSLQNLVGNLIITYTCELYSNIESQIKLGTDFVQVIDIPNALQIQNTNLANIIFYHSDAINKMIWNLGNTFSESSTAENILQSLQYGERLSNTILQQIIDSIISTVSIILLTIHREPGLNTDKISTAAPSMYMKELHEFLIHAWSNHIMVFDDKQVIQKCGEKLVTRCVDLFVHNVILLRHISEAGRMRLKNDSIFIEKSLKMIVPNLSAVGKPYRLLRAISAIIVQSPEEIIKQDITTESPIASYIILFLLFGYAGPELQSPHEAAHWSNERLINWLQGQTQENTKLELVSGALQRYREDVRRKNTSTYDPVYPLIANYFAKALHNLNSVN